MNAPIHERFAEQARRTPAALALHGAGGDRTYAALAERVGRVAGGLARLLPPGARVAIHRHKSADAIADMLACLSAGCAYVPVDPSGPPARSRFVVEDSQADALLADERTVADWIAPGAGAPPILVGPTAGGRAHERHLGHEELMALGAAPPPPSRTAGEADTAYILYTSGSTGVPKGVEITHGNAAAFVDWGMEAFDVGPDDRVALHAPLHFDLPVFDLYVGLARGATVCPVDETALLFPEAVLRFLRAARVTVLYAVPSALIALLRRSSVARGGLPDLRLLLHAGEEFPPPRLRELRALLPAAARVFNLYGPVETNVVTFGEVGAAELEMARLPIGRPVDHARVFLVDDAGARIPPERVGLEGEILVAGPSVSPGYWRRPELTAASRASIDDGGRAWTCHRTGDRGSWGAGGVLHFHGRRDGQIKSRGVRIDLGEIESVLAAMPEVAETAAVAVPHPEQTNVVVAFVVAGERGDRDEGGLLARCRERLPPSMIPGRLVWREELPRTSTGKVDRARLAREAAEEPR